jgi:hypothetical protein
MKYSKMAGGLVLAVTLMASMAFAGSKRVSMEFSTAVQVNGKQLPAGSYRLKWEGDGPAVQVQFLKGKKVVATAPARVEQTPRSNEGAAVIDNAGDAHNLVEARLAGRKYKLVFVSPEAQAQNSHGGGTSAQTNR